MKTVLIYFQIVLLMCGVFGADEVKSVMEGESVTLNPDLTQIQGINEILWRFGEKGSTVAQIDGNVISYEDVKGFKGRLQLDQTGSLTITNVRINHSGLYKAEIIHKSGTSYQKFSVTVYESPSVIAGAEAEMKLVSVKKGDPVILQTDAPQLTGDELIVWRFGDEGKLIAKADIEAKSSSLYDETDERFRDRLKLNQTVSLTITNTRTTDSGEYKVKISSNKQTLYKRFTVTVSEPDPGYSGGAVALIVIVVLLLTAAVAGVMYFYRRPRTTELPNQTWRVPVGDYITLNPEPEIQRGDKIQWLFGAGDTLIAEIKGENREMKTYSDGPDERFMNILKLETTGSLTIESIDTDHSGLYTLKIRRGRETFYKRFHVSVGEMMISVMEGDDVPLEPDTKIQKGDEIQWLFDDKEQIVLTEIKNTKVTEYTGTDWRFRDRLKLDEETGKLTITNILTEHEGYYTLKITRDRGKIYKRFYISVRERKITGMEGKPVTLNPVYEIKKDDVIRWLFGDEEQPTLIAEFNVKTGEILTYADVADERFRDRLELNKKTGDLTINNMRTAHTGVYKLQIRSSSGVTEQIFTVTVCDKVEEKIVEGGDSVTLNPDTEIQSNDQILWMFGDLDKLIAQIRGGTVETYDDVNERFRGRLKLDKTGSLTITDIEAEHTGRYKLQIISSRGTLCKRFQVSIKARIVEVTAGESVHLKTDLTEIERDEGIEWRFGKENSLIAEIKGGTVETHDVPDERFRDRLELDEKTGDLIIKNSRDEHDGRYTLKIRSIKGNKYWTYTVIIRERDVEVTAGESVRLNTGLTEIQRDEEIEWRFGYKNSLIAEIKGGTVETRDGPDERFRDRLQLNKKTGDLIINDSTDEHTGRYTLKIRSSKGNTNRKYIVTIRARIVEVTAGESVRLNTGLTEIERDEGIEWRFGKENSLIAEIKGGTVETHDVPDERFRDRLELDEKTGDLIIKNSTDEHTGRYTLKICSSEGNTNRTYFVNIRERDVEVTAGESVRLNTGLTEIERDEGIEWRFGYKNSLIAEIKGGTGKTHDVPDKRFRNRLELNKKTGDLIIKNSTAKHAGPYTLKIRSSKGNTNRKYIVTIRERIVEVTVGESVRLNTDLTEIQTDDEIEWRFGDKNSLIAEIKGRTGVTHDGPDQRFRDRLELNKKTGNLTINDSRAEHAGRYKLKIRSSKGNTYWTYIVIVRGDAVTNEARTESSMKEKTDSRRNQVNESVTVEMEKKPLLNRDDLNVVNEEVRTSSL